MSGIINLLTQRKEKKTKWKNESQGQELHFANVNNTTYSKLKVKCAKCGVYNENPSIF